MPASNDGAPLVGGPLRDLFARIDARDADGFAGFLSEDAVLRFGSAPPVHGADAIRQAIGAFFESIKALSHEIDYTAEIDGRVVCEGHVTYTRHDDSRITLPFIDVLVRAPSTRAGLTIDDYRIYMDVAPLYASAPAAAGAGSRG